MDLKITRNSNRLNFGIYRKPTHTECHINSNGYNPKSQQCAVAAHVWKVRHAMDHKPVLLKQASNKQELNWENILITKNKDRIINFEILPADHLTLKFILNPVEDSRSAPTRKNQSVMG